MGLFLIVYMQNFDLVAGAQKLSYQYPESLDEITLGQLINYQNNVESQKPKSLFEAEDKGLNDIEAANYINGRTKDERLSWLEFYALQVSYWCNMPIEHARAINIGSLVALRNRLADTLSKFHYDDSKTSFDVDGIQYAVPEKFMQGSTLKEFIESMEYEHLHNKSLIEVSEEDEYKAYVEQMKKTRFVVLPKIMSLICHRIEDGKPVEYYDKIVEDNEKIMLNAKLSDALNIAFFLLKLKMSYIRNSLTLMSRPQ